MRLSRYLVEQGHTVSVLNPAVLLTYRQSRNTRSKTDKLDALGLAHYARERQPRAWHPFPAEVVALRSLLAYRSHVQHMLLQARNRQRCGGLETWVAGRLQTQIEQLVNELKLVEERIWKHVEANAKLSAPCFHLQTICGIGRLAAAQLIAQIGEIERFSHPGALVSLGVWPSNNANRAVRFMDVRRWIVMAAAACASSSTCARWSRCGFDPQLRAWAQRLKACGKPSKVVLVAVMRKLLPII